ncbi:unnamed protein product [Arctia plantaginis]|uniref:Uncharacterized protein n=1 Tax=Arctia plantaginis TaxID=874455 RepID=A0A8S1B1B5_ARCPL|nr:unnamed protein product [Arctia plantaginis]
MNSYPDMHGALEARKQPQGGRRRVCALHPAAPARLALHYYSAPATRPSLTNTHPHRQTLARAPTYNVKGLRRRRPHSPHAPHKDNIATSKERAARGRVALTACRPPPPKGNEKLNCQHI